ncbi:aspartate 1-decarboxylase [Nocardiopsis sp. NPDC049922]|uniref:aspartate 1-decarboxylase n=1 Tax=Nocardiopsis sp. NPDC049922 TaxID=3155157 RepID=UPI0033EFAE85
MLRTLMKSKVHRATVTEADLHYVGSLTLDRELMTAADLYSNEKVQVVDIDNGERFETYVIEGAPGSGVVCLNGAAARLVQPGDRVIIISYAEYQESEAPHHRPQVVVCDENNRGVLFDQGEPPSTTADELVSGPSDGR